ncbi:single-stranded DNA-binding protein [Deinococcus sonorensis]|uniref:Single-stranded DNA-binding protein n=2 Tax=Deinococcus sonorensis TaxID=309891 RepID=A0AAU7UAA0_9DEIO
MSELDRAREALRQALHSWAVLTVRGDRAQVMPAPDLDLLYAGLDRTLGNEWAVHYRAEHVAPPVVVARLTLSGMEREGLAQGHSLDDARRLALADALRAFGVTPAASEAQWVEYDEEEGANVHELDQEAPATAAPATTLPPAPPRDPQLERARQHIDDLLEQLREAGLGAQAARVLARRGYGNTLDESREVYKELKGLPRH